MKDIDDGGSMESQCGVKRLRMYQIGRQSGEERQASMIFGMLALSLLMAGVAPIPSNASVASGTLVA
jgi:hypothetical protein